jgi:hypothetical protein
MGTADWTKARLYQWHAIERVWKAMAPAQNLSHYMDVLETITENAADGIFSNVFCRVLFAQQAAINTLESQLIRIANAIYGGERFNTDGSVLDSAKPGFWLGADGRLIASNAQISGIVNATSGTFNDITISGDSLFQGAINSGPLVLSNDTPQGKEFTYAVGTGTSIIYNDAKDYFGFAFNATADSFEEKSYSVIGTYGDMSIIRIGHYWENGGHGQYYNRTIYVYNINGEKIRIAYNNSAKDYLNIQSILSFRYALSGKTFKLLDLPIMKGAPGAVYNDNGTLKISP